LDSILKRQRVTWFEKAQNPCPKPLFYKERTCKVGLFWTAVGLELRNPKSEIWNMKIVKARKRKDGAKLKVGLTLHPQALIHLEEIRMNYVRQGKKPPKKGEVIEEALRKLWEKVGRDRSLYLF
jgi:hypothetical protein